MTQPKTVTWEGLASHRFKAFCRENPKALEAVRAMVTQLTFLYFHAREHGFQSEETFEGLSQMADEWCHKCVGRENEEGTFE